VNGIRNWLCFPVIAHDNKFLVSRIDLAKTIEPQLRPHMIQRSGKIQTIVLDPGHGGYDKGAASTLDWFATGFRQQNMDMEDPYSVDPGAEATFAIAYESSPNLSFPFAWNASGSVVSRIA